MHHVVADLHVLDDLREGEQHGAGGESGAVAREDQRPSPRGLEVPLGRDDAPDVGRVGGAEVVANRAADGVELFGE
jgi:hypothetical protein